MLQEGSWVLHDVAEWHILASHSSPSRAPSAHVIQVGKGAKGSAEKRWELGKGVLECAGAKLLRGIQWSVQVLSVHLLYQYKY